MGWILARLAAGRKWLRTLKGEWEPPLAYRVKVILLAGLACALCLGSRIVFVFSWLYLQFDGMSLVPREWVVQWNVAVAMFGGLAWLCTRDILFESASASSPRQPILSAVFLGMFVGALWFSFLALLSAVGSFPMGSMLLPRRPVYQGVSLCTTGIVSAIAGSIFYHMLRGTQGGATPPL